MDAIFISHCWNFYNRDGSLTVRVPGYKLRERPTEIIYMVEKKVLSLNIS